jgi:hypothetical protein
LLPLLLLLFCLFCFLPLLFLAAFFHLLGFPWLCRTLGQKARLTFPGCGVGAASRRLGMSRDPGQQERRRAQPQRASGATLHQPLHNRLHASGPP